MAPGSKGWSDILLMIRLLFIVPVSNTKLKRWFPKLKHDKTNLCCSYWCQLFGKYFDYGKRVGVRRLDPILAIKKWNIDKVRCTAEEKGSCCCNLSNSAKVNVKSLSDDDSCDKQQNISENGSKKRYLISSDFD